MKPRQSHEKREGAPCKNCGGTLRYGRSYSCVTCTNSRSMKSKKTAAYRDQAKRYWMAKRYGLTPEDVNERLTQQGDGCGCCGAKSSGNANGWAIDHDHRTGAVRGILCHGCNIGLGGFDDNPERLRKAIEYLVAHATEGLDVAAP